MLIIIFSYNRLEMLKQIVERIELKRVEYPELDYFIIDDGSDFDMREICDWTMHQQFRDNGGKEYFWNRYHYAIATAKNLSKSENFIFMPDDFLDLDIDDLMVLADTWKGLSYSLNLINDGRVQCWGHFRQGIKPIAFNGRIISEVGFNDCGFMCNRSTLEQIEIKPVPEEWFDGPNKSSGVGAQLTKQMRKLEIPMLKPNKSFATHGEHDSVMHGEHRKHVTLKSI